VENRGEFALGWRHRGPLLIHACLTWDQEGYEFLTKSMDEYVPSRGLHVFGAIQGIVDLVDIVTSRDDLDPEARRWFFGDVGLVLENPREFKKPIPHRGHRGLFNVLDGIIKE